MHTLMHVAYPFQVSNGAVMIYLNQQPNLNCTPSILLWSSSRAMYTHQRLSLIQILFRVRLLCQAARLCAHHRYHPTAQICRSHDSNPQGASVDNNTAEKTHRDETYAHRRKRSMLFPAI